MLTKQAFSWGRAILAGLSLALFFVVLVLPALLPRSAVGATLALPAPEPSAWGDFFAEAFHGFSTWQSGAWLAFIIVIVNLLVHLTRLPPFSTWLDERKWVRAVLALALGTIFSVVTAVQGGTPWDAAIIHGIASGLGSIGAHVVSELPNKKKQDEKKIGKLALASQGKGLYLDEVIQQIKKK